MKKGTKIAIGVGIGVVAIGVTTFIFRKQIKNFLSTQWGLMNKYARQAVWDAQTEAKIKSLHPKMQPKVREFINKAEKAGYKIRITSTGGYRTFAEQNKLHAQGRSTSGNVVTNAKAGQSYHNYGLAVDVVEVEPQYGFKKGYPKERWNAIGKIGQSVGLKWGASFGDKPHFELDLGTWQQLLALHNAGKVDKQGYVLA